jgi:uncharacterized protein
MKTTARDWIDRLDLMPHPEGGWYRETYRCAESTTAAALPTRFRGARHHATAIYYLLEEGDFSAWHRIHSDEIWHVYAGSLELAILTPAGELSRHRLGVDPAAEELPQFVVPHGQWFAARPRSAWVLTGCTVAPGFDFADFEMAVPADLLAAHPSHAAAIREFSRL